MRASDDSIARVRAAIANIGRGHQVVLAGDHGKGEPNGHLMMAGSFASASSMAFMVRYGSGFVCASVTNSVCEVLGLVPMTGTIARPAGCYYTVSVDAVDCGTGISATDRAGTVRQLADPEASRAMFSRPGHVMPRRGHTDGVLGHRGVAEALTDLLKLANLGEVGVYTALESTTNSLQEADAAECIAFAEMHGLAWLTIDDIVVWRCMMECHVERSFGPKELDDAEQISAAGFTGALSGIDYLVYLIGSAPVVDPLVRVHHETAVAAHLLTPDPALLAAVDAVRVHGGGVVVLERWASGRLAASTPLLGANLEWARAADIAQILEAVGVVQMSGPATVSADDLSSLTTCSLEKC